ncbi:alpha/beta hydrolase [Microcella humidisoli]|uniref:Alpha/beta-hydrolase family protein n=1 Tax=Microcella humidisoli TaxID=2963406 RepID=A0ABY5FYP7_9MICO|nr:alpha/beta-hydrolase family protein [Microcella humidisoli]UTT63450.1 alpha/beta-hydrolase family protein [Microcella humidisoli]
MTARRWWHLDPGGVLVGLVVVALSLTPSLLPRPALLQGVLSGASFAIGYALGAFVWWFVRSRFVRTPSPRGRRFFWVGMLVLSVVVIVVVGVLAVRWQNEVRALVEVEPIDAVAVGAFLLGALLTAALLLVIGRGVRRMTAHLVRLAGRAVGGLVASAVVAASLLLFGMGVVAAIDAVYADRNGAPDADLVEPASAVRSAGPDSVVDWEGLGRHGAAFIAGGPSAAEIERLTGVEAREPVRVYVGIGNAATVDERAALAVDELRRTGAFDRELLVVATTTGSGWLEDQAVDAVEYLHAGDTAIVAVQYAYTPSWVSFLFDPDAPVAAARATFEAVHAEWSRLPADDRPRLVTYGLSLGAHGAQEVFADLDELRDRTDGALFVGSPPSADLWRELQSARDAGSPAWQPVLDGGERVRWISRPGDLERLTGPWDEPRVLYLQHATDPITWLTADLLWSEPEWLRDEQRGPDVSPSMRWIPVVTGLQVTIDMLMGQSVPARHGHNFGDVVVDGWRAVTGDAGLAPAALDALRAEIESYALDDED